MRRTSMRELVAMGLAGALALAAACGSSKESEERARVERAEADVVTEHARMEELAARVKATAAEEQMRSLARDVRALESAMKTLDDRLATTTAALAAAKTQEDRDRVAARLADIQRDRAELQARIDKFRAGLSLRCPPDNPGC